EAHVLDAGLALGGDDDRAVGPLHRVDALEPLADPHGRAVGALADDAGRVARKPPGEAEGVRPFRVELGADHDPSLGLGSADAAPGRLAGLAAEPRTEAPAVP